MSELLHKDESEVRLSPDPVPWHSGAGVTAAVAVAVTTVPPPALPSSLGPVVTPVEPRGLPLPEEVLPLRVRWPAAIVLTAIHLVALLAFLPWSFAWLFTWSGLALAILGHFVFGMFGVTIGYHRLLTHRGFTCPRWMGHTLAVLGMCNLQDSPAHWVAVHRMHHRHSDQQADPHSPLVNFLWGHVGWVVHRHRIFDRTIQYAPYVGDLLRDPFYLRLERNNGWLLVFLAHAVVITAAGALVGYLSGGANEALRYAASWAVWAVVVRTVFVLHGTWSVNSLAHMFGYRNYPTKDASTNNWLVALFTHGEGWHNNHHADPQAASHGHRWWEFDMSWWIIRMLESVGLVKNVVRPKAWGQSAG